MKPAAYPARPLSHTLMLRNTPQQLADQLGGLRISGGILLDAKTAAETPFQRAHRLLSDTITALIAIEESHDHARAVADLVTDALNLFEDKVQAFEVQAARGDTVRELTDKEDFKELHFGGEL